MSHTRRDGWIRLVWLNLGLLGFFPGWLIAAKAAPAAPAFWATPTREQRPWAYWWWMGSAVDPVNLRRELARYRAAGFGGVHIIPIYGAKGWETNYISYLSPRWMEMLKFTVTEANRLDLGVDMTTGSGWCFGGGPNVTEADGNASVEAKEIPLAPGAVVPGKFDPTRVQALVAFAADGRHWELNSKLRSDGTVDWRAPEAVRVFAISEKFSGQKVKRAGPGGEGPMLNLLNPDAMAKFLQPFSRAFADYRGPKPRAQYHDSYEYKTDWSPVLFQEFERRRGYRLQSELPALFGSGTNDHAARVRCDYRETVSDIQIEASLPRWVEWSHHHGFLTRNEAHGSPGNLLDLYALADVPETEMFHLDRSRLISKFASSAAHVTGKKLVASETGTWLEEHFTETLADMKFLVDDMFLSGVNHIFYHGMCYSPDEAGWPGWLFYASYEMNPRNSIWRDVPALNQYVARCQGVLQAGRPDQDVLVYWPLHDFWSRPGGRLLPHLTVHAREWFEGEPIGRLARALAARGYGFDYASDRQLSGARVTRHGVELGKNQYRVVLVPDCALMPLATFRKLLALADAGATVIFENHLPSDVPGAGQLEPRRAEFNQLVAHLKMPLILKAPGSDGRAMELRSMKQGRGGVMVGDWGLALESARVPRETLVDQPGLMCIRRALDSGWYYFIANRGEQNVAGWIPLAHPATAIQELDPLSGRIGRAATRPGSNRSNEVYLKLAPGASILLQLFPKHGPPDPAWVNWQPGGSAHEITTPWTVDFISGGPELPPSQRIVRPATWTAAGGEAERFAGTARYSTTFDAPAATEGSWLLSLGRVCQSARVRLNGSNLGTLLVAPFQVVLPQLRPTGNRLEVEVTNVSANRIRDLDRRHVSWKNFHDINFVNLDYRPFNASDWPVRDSGLLGPVTLTPLTAIAP